MRGGRVSLVLVGCVFVLSQCRGKGEGRWRESREGGRGGTRRERRRRARKTRCRKKENYLTGQPLGHASEIDHFLLETIPREAAVEADAHVARGGEDERELDRGEDG